MSSKSSLLLSTLLAVVFSLSCKKECPAPEPEIPLTKSEILVKHTWQVDEVQRSIEGENQHYIRGGQNTTGVNYGAIRLTFKSDGTGTYIDEVGTSHTTTWQFTTPDEYNLKLTIGPPFANTFNWTLVEVTEKAMHNTTAVGTDVLVSARYVPVVVQ